MKKFFFESIIVGFSCILIGQLGFMLSNNKKENKRYSVFYISFFITGIVIHILLSYIGFNKIYCNRTCRKSLELLNN